LHQHGGGAQVRLGSLRQHNMLVQSGELCEVHVLRHTVEMLEVRETSLAGSFPESLLESSGEHFFKIKIN
jgi:hypothetical protein